MDARAKSLRSVPVDALRDAIREGRADEAAVLERLIVELARGNALDDVWTLLREVAERDERTAELAFAYERFCQPKALRALSPQVQADTLVCAATFFDEVFGDPDGAIAYLERALVAHPPHAPAFERLEQALAARSDGAKLCDLYVRAAAQRPHRDEQLRLLRRAAELSDVYADDARRVVPVYEQLVRLDPSDASARRALASWYARAGRHADLAKLLEQALARTLPDDEAESARTELMQLYVGQLRQPDRALPHVEHVLRGSPAHPPARAIAAGLLASKTVAARAAEALEGAHERLGETSEQARMLEAQIDALRGPQRVAPQKRLAKLRFLVDADLGAMTALERALVADPSDAEIRMMYRDIASTLGRRAEAAAVLGKMALNVREPELRGALGLETGQLWLDGGDAKRARAAFSAVLAGEGASGDKLAAARALRALLGEAADQPALLAVLERLTELEETPADRHAALLRLAQVAVEVGDRLRARSALEALAGTSLASAASLALEGLYESLGAWSELAGLIEARAAEASDRALARRLDVRAAELRTERGEAALAADAWRRIGERYGHDTASRARLAALLEPLRRWDELAILLSADAAASPPAERVAVLSRLAQLRATKSKDLRGALEACREALSLDAEEKGCRELALRALAGEERELAADILAPIARAAGDDALLARALEARAKGRPGREGAALLDEAAELLVGAPGEEKRAIELAGRALAEAVAHDRARVGTAADRVERLAASGSRARAEALAGALVDVALDDETLASLARRAGEAAAAGGDTPAAVALFRRALAFEPGSVALVARLDGLLREQGAPVERVALHRAALTQTTEPARRRELRRAIATIERRDLGDTEASVATLRAALAEDPLDVGAHETLVETYAASGRLGELYELLGARLPLTSGDERRALGLRMAEVAVTRGEPRVASAHYAEALAGDAPLDDDVLDAIERLATSLGDAELSCRSLERRAALALDPQDEACCLDRLGDARAACGRLPEAVAAWRRASSLHEEAGDEAGRVAALTKLVAAAPDDSASRDALVAAHHRAADWPAVSALLEGAYAIATTDAARAQLLLRLEHAAVLGRRADELAARASALAGSAHDERTALLELSARLLDAASPAGAAARRALFAHRVESATERERAGALLAWARAEEDSLGDPARAAELYRRVLTIDPEEDDALASLVRVLARGTDLAATRDALGLLRARRDGEERLAIDRRLAELALAAGDVPAALAALEPLLDASPGDELARGVALACLGAATTEDERARAAALLLRAAESAPTAEAILRALLAATAGDRALASVRAGCLERLLDLVAADPPTAFDLVVAGARELPTDDKLWARAESLARSLGRVPELATAYRDALAQPLAPELAEKLGRAAIELHDEWLDDPLAVEALLERVFQRSSAAWAFDRLKAAYVARERWSELLALYDVAIARAVDGPTRAELCEDAAQAADFAHEPARAIGYLEALLVDAPSDRVSASLERLYERSGRLPELVALLERRMSAGDAATRFAAALRVAMLWVDAGDGARALPILERLIGEAPDRGESFDVLERLLVVERHSLPPMVAGVTVPPPPSAGGKKAATVRQRAAAILKKRYQAGGRAHDLARVLDVELEAATSKKDRVRRYRELATLRADGLGDARGALEDVAALALLEPGEREHRDRLAALAEASGAHERRVEVLVAVAERAKPEIAATILLEAAEAARDVLADAARARGLFRRAMASPSREAALVGARSLAALSADHPPELCEALERVVALERSRDLRLAALASLGHLAWDVLADRPRALAAFRALAKEDPASREALDGLVVALEAEGDVAELCEVLERRAAIAETPALARRDRLAIARVRADSGDVDAALDAVRTLVLAEGASDEVADFEAALLASAGRDDELALHLDGEAVRAEDPARRARMLIGAATARRGSDPARAAAGFAEALGLGDGDEDALAGLSALADGPAKGAAVRALVAHFQRTSQEARLLDLTAVRLAACDGPEAAADVLLEAASLAREAGDPRALGWLSDALGAAPARSDVHDALASLASAAGAWRDVAVAFETAASDSALPRELRRDLLIRVARAHERELGDRRAAEDALARASEGDDPIALAALVALLREAASPALVDALLRWSKATGDDLALRREASETAAEQWDVDRATAIASETLRLGLERFLGPSAPVCAAADVAALDAAVTMLIRAALDRGEPGVAAGLAERAAALPLGEARCRSLLRSAAEIAERDPLDVDRAIRLHGAVRAAGDEDGSSTAALVRILRREGRVGALLSLARERLAGASDPATRTALRLELSSLLETAGDDAAARAELASGLAETPRDDALADALAVSLEKAGLGAELVALLREQAAWSSEPARACRAWKRVAELEGDSEVGLDALRQAAELGDAASLESLARVLLERGEHERAAAALERLWARAEPSAREDATLRLAAAYAAAGLRAEATARLESERARGASAGVLARLAEMYGEDAAWERLAEVVEERAALEPASERRHALLVEAAAVRRDRLGDAVASVRLLEQAAALSPGDGPTVLALAAALSLAGRAEDATVALRALITSYGARRPKERALAHYELARARLSAADRAGALGELDLASRIDPAHPGVLRALGELAFDDGQLDRAQRAYRALLLLLPRRPGATGSGRSVVLVRLARIAADQGESATADELVTSALGHATEHPEERAALDRELRAQGRTALLARSLEERLAVRPPAPVEERLAVLGDLADLYEHELHREGDALTLRLTALGVAPDRASLHEAARGLAAKLGARERYTTALRGWLADGRGDVPALSAHLGRALDGVDDRGAAEAYERALEGTESLAALSALERIYERLGDVRALEALALRAPQGDSAARAESLVRLAGALARSGDAPAAASRLEAAVEASTDERASLDAVAALAHLHAEAEPIVRLYERLARASGRDEALVDALSLVADFGPDAHATLREAAALAEKRGDVDLADRMLRRAIELPVDEASREDAAAAMLALAELRTKAGALGDAAALKDRAASLVEIEDQRALRLEVARLCADELGDLPRAAALYEALLAREHGDPEVWQPLARVYRALGDDAALSALIDRIVDTEADATARAGLRYERATIALRGGAEDRDSVATALLGYALDDDPTHRESSLLLSEILERSGRRSELAAHLGRRIDAAKDANDAPLVVTLSLRLGAMLEEERRGREARDVYHGALDWDAGSRGVLRALARLQESEDDPLDLLAALERLLAVEVGPDAADLALRVASIHETARDVDASLRALEVGYRAHPESERLRRELAQRYGRLGAPERTAELHLAHAAVRAGKARGEPLRRAAEALLIASPDRALSLLEEALAEDPDDRQALSVFLASASRPEDVKRAARALDEALSRAPADGALLHERARLRFRAGEIGDAISDFELALASGAPCREELVAALRVGRGGGADPSARRSERRRLAALLAESGDRDGARAELAEVLRGDGKDTLALRALAAVEAGDGRWDAATAPLRRLLSLAVGDALVDCALDLADACERAGRVADARGGLERAHRSAPADRRVSARLRAVYEALGERRELGAMAREEAAAETDVARRFQLLLEAGRAFLAADPPDAAAALAVLEDARGLRPEDQELTLATADAMARGDRLADALALLDAAIRGHKARRSKPLSALFRKKSALELADGDLSSALASLERAFESDPSDGALALELGLLALDIDDGAVAARAFRAITIMKIAPAGAEGTTSRGKAIAYGHLARAALGDGDVRKARLFAEKSLAEDATYDDARALLDGLRASGPARA